VAAVNNLRAPRVSVLADGMPLGGVESIEVSANDHRAADRFVVRLAAPLSVAGELAANGMVLDLRVSVDAVPGWTSLIQGAPDLIEADPLRGTVTVHGRDLSARFIDAPISELFANMTASEIVEALAARHGIPVQAVATAGLAGRQFQDGRAELGLNRSAAALSQWDMMTGLAESEGYDLFMDGGTLCFRPAEDAGSVMLTPGDCLQLRLSLAPALADPLVLVRTWDARLGEARDYTLGGGGKTGGGGQARRHVLVRPNLGQSDGKRLAKTTRASLLRHARTATLRMPADAVITARHSVMLSGAGMFDGRYDVGEISRTLDVESGFTQRLSLVSPDEEES
jgi:hypothetical protein